MAGESNATRATPRPGSRALPAPRLDAPLVHYFVLTFAGAWALPLRMEHPPYWPRDASTWRRGGPGIGGRGSLRPANRSGGC